MSRGRINSVTSAAWLDIHNTDLVTPYKSYETKLTQENLKTLTASNTCATAVLI